MTNFYILDENKNPVPEPDIMKWTRWYEEADAKDERHIGNDYIPYQEESIQVSTVFLAQGHIDTRLNDTMSFDMLYETMVFAPNDVIERLSKMSETETRSIFCQILGGWDIQKRYRTREEAERGHQAMVQFVTVCLAQMGAVQ